MASVLVSEVDPDVRRLLVLLLERAQYVPVVLDADVVDPPRAAALIVDPISPVSLEHARRVRAAAPELPVVCLNPAPADAEFLRHRPTYFLPKPFAPEQLDELLGRALGCPV